MTTIMDLEGPGLNTGMIEVTQSDQGTIWIDVEEYDEEGTVKAISLRLTLSECHELRQMLKEVS